MDRLHASLARELHWENLQTQQEMLLLLEKSLSESLNELNIRERESLSPKSKKDSHSFQQTNSHLSIEEENAILRKRLDKVKQLTANLLSKHLRYQQTNQSLLEAHYIQREHELMDCHYELTKQIQLKDEELQSVKKRLSLFEHSKDQNSKTI